MTPSVAPSYGHHRVEAVRRAGLTEAEIFVGNSDDQTMVRIYARENATQRNNKATAIDGSVLTAVRLLARQLLTSTYREIATGGVFESEKAFDTAKGTLESGDGIGHPLISKVLKDMPGMTEHGIRDSLSRLKASGDYARTLAVIAQQIEAEAEAAEAELSVMNLSAEFTWFDIEPCDPTPTRARERKPLPCYF